MNEVVRLAVSKFCPCLIFARKAGYVTTHLALSANIKFNLSGLYKKDTSLVNSYINCSHVKFLST